MICKFIFLLRSLYSVLILLTFHLVDASKKRPDKKASKADDEDEDADETKDTSESVSLSEERYGSFRNATLSVPRFFHVILRYVCPGFFHVILG